MAKPLHRSTKKENRTMAKQKASKESQTPTQAAGAIAVNSAFKVLRTLTLPAFKLELNAPYYFHILDAMRISDAKNAKGREEGKKEMEPATVVSAVDAVTGEKGIFIVPAVVKSIWEDEYENDSYVGKTFEVVKLPKPEGKRYHAFRVQEVANA